MADAPQGDRAPLGERTMVWWSIGEAAAGDVPERPVVGGQLWCCVSRGQVHDVGGARSQTAATTSQPVPSAC